MTHTLRTISSLIATFVLVFGVWIFYFNQLHDETATRKGAEIKMSVASLNKRTPLLVNPKLNLYLTQASYEENHGVHYEYKFFDLKRRDVNPAGLKKLNVEFTSSYCENVHKYILEEAGGVVFRYLSQDDVELFILKPHPSDCHA